VTFSAKLSHDIYPRFQLRPKHFSIRADPVKPIFHVVFCIADSSKEKRQHETDGTLVSFHPMSLQNGLPNSETFAAK
jgi:hypothetical protein